MRDEAVDTGQRVARFTLRALLGAGGMGEVWRARDPELERDVAVKLLRPELETTTARAEEARGRLRREAQAMARLAHPNVIPIYEVGEADARVFLVMELVDGGTLSRWLAERPRGPMAVLEVLGQAGRGLAAAHDAGLIHRDFKPDNVLVGTDGRVRVTDFGLVGIEASAEEARAAVADARTDPRTRTGAILGTPAYAAPEVLRGAAATARSDQFSFCVALYEALWGASPFPGDTIADLYQAVTTGAVRPPPSRPAVAPAIRDAVLRGLATDPDQRWPSMAALLVALTPEPRRGRTLAVAAGGVMAFGAAAIAIVARGGGDRGARPALAATVDAAVIARLALAPPIALTDGGGCADSPVIRGDQVVFALDPGAAPRQLYRVPLAGGPAVRLTERPLSSPVAGSRPDTVIAVTVDAPERLVEVDLQGQVTELPSPPALSSAVGFVWHDGALYYARPDRTQVRMIEGGAERAIADLPTGFLASGLALSPDGRWLLVDTGGQAGACAIDRRAATPTPRCVLLPGSGGNTMIVSNDGYLVTGKDGTWRRRFDDAAAPVLVTPTEIDGLAMTASADGDVVVASRCVRRARLIAVPPGGGAPRVLTDGRLMQPTARADGTIALARYHTTQDTVLSVRNPDGALRDLTPLDHIVRSPAWDPSGALLAYRRGGTDGGLFITDLAPSTPRRLTSVSTDDAPVFLADGRVAFARMTAPGTRALFVVDPATGTATPAAHADRWPYDRHPRDGRILVGDPRRYRLWLWDPATDRETEIAHSDDAAADFASFAPDGRSILATWATEVWRVVVADGHATLLYRRADDAAALDGATQLPDGTVVVAERYYQGELFRSTLPAPDREPAPPSR
ncbi:MAG: serine/threonine-protein kinase [Myxococcales bacterium]|nr:serine/threonine-protein kinase [Myxococcales bacterium]